MLLGVVLLFELGAWQTRKAQQSEAARTQHQERMRGPVQELGTVLVDAALVEDVPVQVQGYYLPQETFFVDNRQEEGRAGVHVVTPLRIEGGQTRVLINRGWAAWPQGRGRLPAVDTPTDRVTVRGVAAVPWHKPFLLMPERAEPQSRLWPRLDLPRFRTESAHAIQPVVVLQAPTDAVDDLVRRWPAPPDRATKHRSYALQWYGMAVVLVLFYVVASLRRVRPAPEGVGPCT